MSNRIRHAYRFLIHDRDSIFSKELDEEVTVMGVRVLRTPLRAPKANSVCERFGGTLRRECLDFLIPFNERHLKAVLKTWITRFQPRAATHESRAGNTCGIRSPAPESAHRRCIPAGHAVRRAAVLGGVLA